ncbi:hypothetical protein OG618_36890 [Kitasatospora sp. NBC_01246]|uniref:hypothetical protein n=1 Tax=Kitasatospora sp. NBC_01246 TaxID=2903570 RepID=UPI002E30D4E7|nr:hypothetical protein [Kitasatospora sp. NBC_01246]
MFSGNECAWEDCKVRLVTAENGWIGEIAHIIGAEPTSARHEDWDGKDLDDLRAHNNLILLCKNHAKNIDDKSSRGEFTSEFLRGMKERHEAPYRHSVQQMEAAYRDVTKDNTVAYATTLRRFHDWENLGLTPEEEAQSISAFNRLATAVGTLTLPARQVLALVAGLEEPPDFQLVMRRLQIRQHELVSVCDELKRADVAELWVPEDGDPAVISLRGGQLDDVSEYWDELRGFCADEAIDLEDILIRLDFSLLD